MKKAMNQSTLIMILNGISVFAMLFMTFSFGCFANVNNKMDAANSQRFELTYNANRFMNGSAYLTNQVRAYAATGDQEYYDNYWNEINNLKNRDIGVAKLKEIGITAQEQAMIDEMSNLSNTLVPLETEAMENVAAGNIDHALDFVYGTEYSRATEQIDEIKTEVLASLDDRSLTEINRLDGVSKIIAASFLLCLILVITLQVATVVVTKRKIIRPVTKIRDEMGEIAKGNLSTDFALPPDTSEIGMLVHAIHETKGELKIYIQDIGDTLSQMAAGNMDLTIRNNYRGEFAPIQLAMEGILGALNEALGKISVAAEQVDESAGSVAVSAQSLSQGAAQQTSAVTEVNVSIRELSNQIAQTADHADSAKDCSSGANDRLLEGNQKMQELAQAMADISGSSSRIGGIIKTIEDIAFQTNILALNAAVEAARAGTAGKGFAVVADEVRSLAAKSAEAAKSTGELIEGTLRLVERGVTLTADTTTALDKVVGQAAQSTRLIQEIADFTVQQTASIQQVVDSVDQIATVVQANAATAENSANASEELRQQADALKDSVKLFHLRGSGGRAYSPL